MSSRDVYRNGARVGAYPWWAAVLGRRDVGGIYDVLLCLGLWEMEEGDYYVRGHWNWLPWRSTMWRRVGAWRCVRDVPRAWRSR